jgi:hypothetical protein
MGEHRNQIQELHQFMLTDAHCTRRNPLVAFVVSGNMEKKKKKKKKKKGKKPTKRERQRCRARRERLNKAKGRNRDRNRDRALTVDECKPGSPLPHTTQQHE